MRRTLVHYVVVILLTLIAPNVVMAQTVNLPIQYVFNDKTLAENETVFSHEDFEDGILLPTGMTLLRAEANLSVTQRRDPNVFFQYGFQFKSRETGRWTHFFSQTFQGGPDIEDPDHPGQFIVRPEPHVEIGDTFFLNLIAGQHVRSFMRALIPGKYSWKARFE